MVFLFPLAAVEGVFLRYFPLASQQRGPGALRGSSKHSLEAISLGNERAVEKSSVGKPYKSEKRNAKEEPEKQGGSGQRR